MLGRLRNLAAGPSGHPLGGPAPALPRPVVHSHLVQIQLETERALVSARARGDIAKAWITHCEETIAGVRQALAIDDESASPDSALLKPFPNGQKR